MQALEFVDDFIRRVEESEEKGNALRNEVAELRRQLEASGVELNEERQGAAELRRQLEQKGIDLQSSLRELTGLQKQMDGQMQIKEAVELERANLKKRLEENDSELKSAQQDIKAVLLQLENVQEELDHYFLLSRKQSDMLDANAKLQARTVALLSSSLQKKA